MYLKETNKLMKKLLIAFVIFSFTMFSCEFQEYLFIEKNVSQSKVFTFNINQTGTAVTSDYITVKQIVNSLVGEIDGQLKKKDYTIKELNIRSIGIESVSNANNTASSINIETIYFVYEFSEPTNLAKVLNLPVNTGSVRQINSSLEQSGVEKLNAIFKEALKKISDTNNIVVYVKAASAPATSRASVSVKLHVAFNLHYSYCEESLFIVTSDTFATCK